MSRTGRNQSRPVVAVLLLVLCLAAGPASTEETATIRLSRRAGPPTTTLGIEGRGFGADEVVSVRFDGRPIARAEADGNGSFTVRAEVPQWAQPGPHTFKAKGKTSGFTAARRFLVRTNWHRPGFDDANSGFNLFENVLNRSNAWRLLPQWTQNVSDGLYTPAAVVNGMVYATSFMGTVYAFDADTGVRRWSAQVEGGIPGPPPAVAEGLVFAGNSALDAFTGKLRWTMPFSSQTAPVVRSGTIYIVSPDGSVDALEARTGTLLWTTSIGSSTSGSLSFASGVLYVPGDDGRVYALDSSTGAIRWSVQAVEFGATTAAISQGTGYVSGSDGTLCAFDARTGRVLWRRNLARFPSTGPAVAYGMVFQISVAGNFVVLRAVDAGTGESVWTSPTTDTGAVVANGVVYIGGAAARALDARTGSVLWTGPPGDDDLLAVADGVVYVSSGDLSAWSLTLH